MIINSLRRAWRATGNSERSILPFLILLVSGYTHAGPEWNYSVSWIGNSFSGKQDWVLQDVAGMYVDPEGTLFTNVPWDEGGGNVQEYKDGKLLKGSSWPAKGLAWAGEPGGKRGCCFTRIQHHPEKTSPAPRRRRLSSRTRF